MNTSSIGFPNMFDVARNSVSHYGDNASVASRVKLLLLTEPTELYGEPTYGVGLKKYMFQYNTDNIITLIREKLVEQLQKWEPYVVAEKTEVQRGLLYSGTSGVTAVDPNHLQLTVIVYTTYGETLHIEADGNQLT